MTVLTLTWESHTWERRSLYWHGALVTRNNKTIHYLLLHIVSKKYIGYSCSIPFYRTRSAWSMDQGSYGKGYSVYKFPIPHVTTLGIKLLRVKWCCDFKSILNPWIKLTRFGIRRIRLCVACVLLLCGGVRLCQPYLWFMQKVQKLNSDNYNLSEQSLALNENNQYFIFNLMYASCRYCR